MVAQGEVDALEKQEFQARRGERLDRPARIGGEQVGAEHEKAIDALHAAEIGAAEWILSETVVQRRHEP